MAIKKDTLDDLLVGRDPKEVFSKDGLFDELKKALAERVLNAELDDHLEGEAAEGRANRRNGFEEVGPDGDGEDPISPAAEPTGTC
jgi:putative transposase